MQLKRVIVPALLVFTLSACATVDITDMASNNAPVSSETVKQSNVIKHLSAKLVSTFKDKKWTNLATAKSGQSTADILLRGVSQEAVVVKASTSQQKVTANALSANIREAEHHVFQLTKAAEKYFTLAEDDVILRDELTVLELALLTSRQAEQTFTHDVELLTEAPDLDLAEYIESVSSLRDITDEYGQHVRNIRALSDTEEAAF